MNTKLLFLRTIAFCFILSGCDNSQTAVTKKRPSDIYEGSFIHEGDTVNKTINGVKVGRFITIEYLVPKGKLSTGAAVRAVERKTEDGFYVNNKRVGYWKIYSRYSDAVDTVLYIDGIQQNTETKTYTFETN